MRLVDKWHSRMQGQWFFRIRAGMQQFLLAARDNSGPWADVIEPMACARAFKKHIVFVHPTT